MKQLALAATVALFSSGANAKCNFAPFVGWTIVYGGIVTGYIDERGEMQDHFEGCDWGRVLILDLSKSITCRSATATYSYYPPIVIIANATQMKACIDDRMVDVSR
jgi:hypothetical protein